MYRLHGAIHAYSGSASVSFSTEAQAFFDRLVTPPVDARKTLYAALIDGLNSDGVWASLDALYMVAAFDYATGLTNLVQADYQATVHNPSGSAPTFTQDRGVLGVGVNGKITTQFNPITATTPNYVQDDAMVAAWNRTTTQINGPVVEAITPAAKISIYPKWSDGKAYNNIHGTGEAGPTAGADSSGFFLLQRTGASASALYRNDTLLGNNNTASSAPPSDQICFATQAFEVAACAIGASLDATKRTALYTRIQTYLVAVGAA